MHAAKSYLETDCYKVSKGDMANYTFHANGPGSFNWNLNGNNQDDYANLIISPSFSGTIAIHSLWGDGESERVSLELPQGWSVVRTLNNQLAPVNGESAYYDRAYNVIDDQGSVVGTMSIRDNTPGSIPITYTCFAAGTLITTPKGDVSVERLRVDDVVTTLEYGSLPVAWITSSQVGNGSHALPDKALPVRIGSGNLPDEEPLIVSPQHCILMLDKTNGVQCYVRAKHLAEETNLASFDWGRKQIEYVHVLLSRHATMISNNIPSESFYPGKLAQGSLSATNLATLYSTLPALKNSPVEEAYGPTAASVKKRREVKKLAAAGKLELIEPFGIKAA